jgi:hypothetical protein
VSLADTVTLNCVLTRLDLRSTLTGAPGSASDVDLSKGNPCPAPCGSLLSLLARLRANLSGVSHSAFRSSALFPNCPAQLSRGYHSLRTPKSIIAHAYVG